VSASTKPALVGWEALQAPFDSESISLLPRATGDKDKRTKKSCPECGGYHEFPCIHLSYVGHADITMRLNEVDPTWAWEPMGFDANGLPALDASGGLWAWLTILGSRKPAYGDPGLNYLNKTKAGTPDGMKEAIGDMLRNGAMRFGVGTALWSKSDRAKATLIPEDDGAPAPHAAAAPTASPATAPGKLTEGQQKAIYAIAHSLGWSDEYLHASLKRSKGIDHVGDLAKADASALIEALKQKQADKKPDPEPEPEPEPEFAFDPSAEDIPF
jgi:hypothetical protein